MELPEELWSYIFKFLPKKFKHKTVSLVCKHWLEIVRKDERHLVLEKSFLDKYFDIQSWPVKDRDLKVWLLSFLKLWPNAQFIELDWIGETYDKDFLSLTLDDFKLLLGLSFVKSLQINTADYPMKGPIVCKGIIYNSDSISLQETYFSCKDDTSDLIQALTWLKENVKSVQEFSVSDSYEMIRLTRNPQCVKALAEFLTAKMNCILRVNIYDSDKRSKLSPVLKPLAVSENLTLKEVFITCEKPGYSRDLELLKNLKNLKTIKINKYVSFHENFGLEIPFVGVGNKLKYLQIENAAIRFFDLKIIGKTCQVLETLRIEGAENDKSAFTYLPIYELSHFLSTCICRCTLKELRITNISSIPRDRSC